MSRLIFYQINPDFPVLPDQVSLRCGDGWVSGASGFCYWFGDARLSWSDANKECWKLDSVLLRLYRAQDLVGMQLLLLKIACRDIKIKIKN